AAVIICIILPAIVFPGGGMTISLPVIGQVGDWFFIVILLLSMGRLRNIKKVTPIMLTSAIICLAYFLKGETGTPATLVIIVLLLLVMRGSTRIPAVLLTAVALSAILAASSAFGNMIKSGVWPGNIKFDTIADRITQWEQDYAEVDISKPMQVQRLRVLSAAGGQNGVGLYNGRYRIDSSQTNSDFIVGVLFEELGVRTGVLFIILILLTAYGCYFQGIRAERYHLAVVCFLIGVFIALRVMVNLASATGVSVNIMGLRLGIPIVGLPMPFLSRAGSAGLVLFICLALVDAVKMSWIKSEAKPLSGEALASEADANKPSETAETAELTGTAELTNVKDTETGLPPECRTESGE
ncbi:MAG: FtsW/RodA/SpoVE family cell cycle protein, partial [Clostridiales bacterium]|nr:FtsW/RodA/SpoVE family cell cycle protein [Clostridiales bacterium]